MDKITVRRKEICVNMTNKKSVRPLSSDIRFVVRRKCTKRLSLIGFLACWCVTHTFDAELNNKKQ